MIKVIYTDSKIRVDNITEKNIIKTLNELKKDCPDGKNSADVLYGFHKALSVLGLEIIEDSEGE